jgi:hypothetical protein
LLAGWFMRRGGASRGPSTFWPRVSLILFAGKQGTGSMEMARSCLEAGEHRLVSSLYTSTLCFAVLI